jgi:four helix bundle protein
MRDYKKIRAFQYADRFVLAVYESTRAFPKEELFGLTSQIRRSAVSIAANIAEGASRQHQKDYLNFLYIARGSAAEAEYLLSLASRFSYIEPKRYAELDSLVKETSKILCGLIHAVNKETGKRL